MPRAECHAPAGRQSRSPGLSSTVRKVMSAGGVPGSAAVETIWPSLYVAFASGQGRAASVEKVQRFLPAIWSVVATRRS